MSSDPPTHARSVDEIVGELSSDVDRGLSTEEAARRRRRYGSNTVTSERGTGVTQILLTQVRGAVVGLRALAALVGFRWQSCSRGGCSGRGLEKHRSAGGCASKRPFWAVGF